MILDHVRLKPAFLGGAHSTQSWVLAIVYEDDSEVVVHKLLTHELRRVLADPELLQRFSSGPEGYPLTHVTALTQRIAELQAIADKRKDPGEWDSIQELFHPDMNISDINAAIVALIQVYTKAQDHRRCALFVGPSEENPGTILDQIIASCSVMLWEGRPTQLEQAEQRHAEQVGVAQSSPAATSTDESSHPTRSVAVKSAEALWDLLDMIDSLGDEIKPSDIEGYKAFYRRATAIASLRSQHIVSDGHALMWPSVTYAAVFKHDRSVLPSLSAEYRDLVEIVERLGQGYTYETQLPLKHGHHAQLIQELFRNSHEALRKPVPMLLHCPMCHTKHIDEGEFATKPHHTHACQGFLPQEQGQTKRQRCGHVWRPAIVPTVGVEALPGFLNTETDEGSLLGRRVDTLDESPLSNVP